MVTILIVCSRLLSSPYLVSLTTPPMFQVHVHVTVHMECVNHVTTNQIIALAVNNKWKKLQPLK